MFAEIALPVPFRDYYTYRVPTNLEDVILPGMLAVVPFGRQASIGVVWGLSELSSLPSENIRDISALGDPELMISDDILKLARHICDHYVTTPGVVLKSALPPGTLSRKKLYFYPGPARREAGLLRVAGGFQEELRSFIALVTERPGALSFSNTGATKEVSKGQIDNLIKAGLIAVSPFKIREKPSPHGKERWIKAKVNSVPPAVRPGTKSEALLGALLMRPDGMRLGDLKSLGLTSASAAALAKKGLIEYEWQEKKIAELGAMKSLPPEKAVVLTLWQEAALERLKSSIDSGRHKGFLLYGVTSSGKTQVYLETVSHALNLGKSALVLVPEISLTPQIIARFERFLGIAPLVWHSHLSPTERAIVYRASNSGRASVIIGTRSAVFCPLRNPGLIVVDEEQDHSYKQDDPAPRYNARDAALERGRLTGATVLLGSATPSVETHYLTKTGQLHLLTLPQRVAGFGSPRVELVSTAFKAEPKANEPPIFPRGFRPISERLYEEITIRLKKKEQVIILLNRRGYSSAVVCFDCGWIGKCPDCDIGWTYHKATDKMVCHYCGRQQRGPVNCQRCGSLRLSFRSAGTQRLEETIKRLLPHVRAIRLDTDVASGKWEARNVLDDFGHGKYQILFGTQMVAKGHHFPRVGLVGVVSSDIGLSLPDFRATERVMQLLTQAAGRAGRSSRRGDPGHVLIQTFSPENPIFDYLKTNDYLRFAEDELKVRNALGYPPFKRLISIVVSSTDITKSRAGASKVKDIVAADSAEYDMEILGPVESPIFKRGRLFRHQMLLKTPSGLKPKVALTKLLEASKELRGIIVRIDVDPVNFM
jgi:primosomal protein N' (replication factor Y)